jgi:hypothetical protein
VRTVLAEVATPPRDRNIKLLPGTGNGGDGGGIARGALLLALAAAVLVVGSVVVGVQRRG